MPRSCGSTFSGLLRVYLGVIQHRCPALRITPRCCGCIPTLLRLHTALLCIQHTTMLRALLLIGSAVALQPVKLPDGFKAPEPKPLQIGDSEIPDLLNGAPH